MTARVRSGALVATIATALVAVGVSCTALADQNSRRIEPSSGTPEKTEKTGGEAYRVQYGWAVLYLSPFFEPHGKTYDLIIHFHGAPFLQEENIERTHLNAAVVSINVGISASSYSNCFAGPRSLDSLVEETQRQVARSGRAPGAHVGRIALSAWSAGFGAVGSILATPGNADKVDTVLLEDAPHANYLAPNVVNDGAIQKWVDYAVRAMKGEKLFALTHSSIMTEGYPSTTETIGEMIKMLGVPKVAHPVTGPRGMREIYETDRGNFHVKGYEGTQKEDHIDHIKGMSETVLPYLKARWSTD